MTTNHTKRKRKQSVTFSAKLSCGQIINIANIFVVSRVSIGYRNGTRVPSSAGVLGVCGGWGWRGGVRIPRLAQNFIFRNFGSDDFV